MSSEENKFVGDAPKTPGGISKRFFTPCRPLGLSRKYKPGSFISPLSQNKSNVNITSTKSPDMKNRKKRFLDLDIESNLKDSDVEQNAESDPATVNDIISTPIKEISGRKKPKVLRSLSSKNNSELENKSQEAKLQHLDNKKHRQIALAPESENAEDFVSTNSSSSFVDMPCTSDECVVVIEDRAIDTNIVNIVDNDADNIPLNKLNNNSSKNEIDDDNDFSDKNCDVSSKVMKLENKKIDTSDGNLPLKVKRLESKTTSTPDLNVSLKVKKLEDKKTSTSDISLNKNKRKRKLKEKNGKTHDHHLSQKSGSFSDDDDDDFELDSIKRCFIRKSYNKTKLSRAKSTGSITRKDLDELKAQIEMKKNVLLAKSKSEDIGKLVALNKQWQKGHQNAHMLLLDLLKEKHPENQSMNYGEILNKLNIPPKLAGYDEQNDCFVSPNDVDIILM